jgi:hypothetical protein
MLANKNFLASHMSIKSEPFNEPISERSPLGRSDAENRMRGFVSREKNLQN